MHPVGRNATIVVVLALPAPALAQQPTREANVASSEIGKSRLLPGIFEVDLEASISGRGWIPQQYADLDIATTGFASWSVGVRMNILDYFKVRKAAYESTGLASPISSSTTVASAADKAGTFTAALLNLVGGLKFDKSWTTEILMRHDRQVFKSVTTPRSPTRVVPYDFPTTSDPATLPQTMTPIVAYTAFDTTILGIRQPFTGKTGDYDPYFFVGGGYTEYQKPYELRIGDTTFPGYLFDARFMGGGLAVGASKDVDTSTGGWQYDASMQAGIGQIRLAKDFEISQYFPADKGLGFVQGHVMVGYLYKVARRSWSIAAGIKAEATADYFFVYDKADSSSGNTLQMNWDVLVGGDAHVVVGF